MTFQKNHDGTLVISEVIDGYLVTKRFIGYNKTEATRLGKREGTRRRGPP